MWCWSDCEEILHVQGQRSPSKVVEWAKSHLQSNPIPTRDAQRAQTYLVHTRTQRPHDRARAVFGCLLRRYGSAVDCCGGRGSECSRPGYGINPVGEGRHKPTIEPPELTQDWGNRLCNGTNRTCVHQDPGERNNDPTRD